MKKKFLLVSMAMILVALASVSLVKAAPRVEVFGYTDKPQYKPGETVTLKLYIYNWGPEDIVLKNVSIVYPWYSPLWTGGNITIKNIDAALIKEKSWNHTETFTIPTDGRAAYGGGIDIDYVYTVGGSPIPGSDNIYLYVAANPVPATLVDMDKIVTLFTVLVVLTIVCTVIIAATIFLARRPQVTWKAEEKA